MSVARLPGEFDDDVDKVANRWSVERKPGTRRAVADYGRRFGLHQLLNLLKAARLLSVVGPIKLEHLRAVVALHYRGRLSAFDSAAAPKNRTAA